MTEDRIRAEYQFEGTTTGRLVPERRVLLVGSHFAGPATTLLQALGAGTPLYFESEPDNPYDALAIKVFVLTKHLDQTALGALEEALNARGETLETIAAQTSWCLGHVGASGGKPLLKARLAGLRGLVGTAELAGEDLPRGFLEFSSDGQFVTARLEEDLDD